MSRPGYSFYEFFAGGGMARQGLGEGWDCLFANDFDPLKAAAYRDNFGDADLVAADVWTLKPEQLPRRADLVWASSPCQDFSLAGARAGLAGGRSSALLGLWSLMEGLCAEGRAPRTLVIENVTGLLSARGGTDFAALLDKMAGAGYRYGAVEIDAAAFVPQSRPRIFVVATRESTTAREARAAGAPFHSQAIQRAYAALPAALKASWVWWRLPTPPLRNTSLAEVLEADAPWSSSEDTGRLLALMSPLHRARLAGGEPRVGAAYRRIRVEQGRRLQRAEARFDGLAGCLRTPAGGSSRQFLLRTDGVEVRSRLLTPREGARLMGLPDSYRLPKGSTAAWRVVGDGVAAPVVRWLAAHLLEPLLAETAKARAA